MAEQNIRHFEHVLETSDDPDTRRVARDLLAKAIDELADIERHEREHGGGSPPSVNDDEKG